MSTRGRRRGTRGREEHGANEKHEGKKMGEMKNEEKEEELEEATVEGEEKLGGPWRRREI